MPFTPCLAWLCLLTMSGRKMLHILLSCERVGGPLTALGWPSVQDCHAGATTLGPDRSRRWAAGTEEGPLVRSAWWRCGLVLPPPCRPHTLIYTHRYAHTYTHIYMHTDTCTHTHIYMHTYTDTHTCIHTYMHTRGVTIPTHPHPTQALWPSHTSLTHLSHTLLTPSSIVNTALYMTPLFSFSFSL